MRPSRTLDLRSGDLRVGANVARGAPRGDLGAAAHGLLALCVGLVACAPTHPSAHPATDAGPPDAASLDGAPQDGGSFDADSLDAPADAAPLLPPLRDASLRSDLPDAALDGSVADAGFEPSPIGTDGLVSWYPFDGDLHDGIGPNALVAEAASTFTDERYTRAGQAYGPSGRTAMNGASSASFTTLDVTRGLTLEGWARGRGNNAGGVLFGWGNGADGTPTLAVLEGYGFLSVRIGRDYRNVFVGNFARVLGDACWHHVALVLPPGFLAGAPFQLFVDGVASSLGYQDRISPGVTAGVTAVLNTADNVFGSPFLVGTFSGGEAGTRQVDDVRVWQRSLTSDELLRLSTPAAGGPRCLPPAPPVWAPGPRCAPSSTALHVDLGVRVLTDDTIAVISDPNPWMVGQLRTDCGAFLDALDAQRGSVLAWEVSRYYDESALEVQARFRPILQHALDTPGYFALVSPAGFTAPTLLANWPQSTREWVLPRSLADQAPVRTSAAEVVDYSYLRLSAPLVAGGHYAIDDGTGARVEFDYDPASTVSWALQVDQLGYAVDAPKYAYLGAWLGPAGALDLARFEGGAFRVVRESDGASVYTGTIHHRSAPTFWGTDAQPVTGADVYELDFSSLTANGRYHVEVVGAGRSWSFSVGNDALGEAFYTHARSLYHARCGTEISAAFTPWHRGDGHGVTRRGGFPSESDDYRDHAADGWGFRSASGAYVAYGEFDMVSRTATDTVLPGVSGGWHDAADFDRASWHLSVQDDLAHAYLYYPEHFSDGQLAIPESGNGVPDLLDESVWGLDVFRLGQESDGRTAIHVEATSHPRVEDPALDPQPYYLGLGTRSSSLEYASRAALLSRALTRAGDTVRAAEFLASARAAWTFGTGPTRVTFTVPGTTDTWTEPATPPVARQLAAAVQLWLATGDSAFRVELDRADLDTAFQREANNPLLFPYLLLDVALEPTRFPPTWAPLARASILSRADLFAAAQDEEPYRKYWYAPTHGYFWTLGWGQGHFQPLRFALAAYLLTGDARYRAAALLGMNWEQGANPQGRVQTTGLGSNGVVAVLHLPSFMDGIDEPVPGLTPFGYGAGLPYNARTRVWGVFADADPGTGFEPIAEALLPAPWSDSTTSLARIGEVLYSTIPVFRRYVALEAQNPATTEMDVRGMGSGAAIAGMLLEPRWAPSPALLARRPRTDVALRDSRWYFP